VGVDVREDLHRFMSPFGANLGARAALGNLCEPDEPRFKLVSRHVAVAARPSR
jgi:hypothetical protein